MKIAPTKVYVKDLGLIDYKKAWDFQKKMFDELLEAKSNLKTSKNQLLFCEHQHVYTLGKSGKRTNLLISDEKLARIEAKFYKVDRGGDITYHGPGQIVGYLIFDLDDIATSIKDFVFNIEEVIIRTLSTYTITATRLDKATGVWLDAYTPKARKIAAIGMRIHNHVTMHGFALNVNTSLDYFNNIVACGLSNKGVTTLEKEMGTPQNLQEVKKRLLENFSEIFTLNLERE